MRPPLTSRIDTLPERLDANALDRVENRILVRLAADGHLKNLLAVLLDAEEADVADVMMAAGIDAARNVDVQPPEALRKFEIAKPPRQFLRHRDRARIGKAAIVEAGARDDVGDEPDIRRCEPERVE